MSRLAAVAEADDSADIDDSEAILELLDQLIECDPWVADQDATTLDSSRADFSVDMGRVALESILRNVTLVVSTRVSGAFNVVGCTWLAILFTPLGMLHYVLFLPATRAND